MGAACLCTALSAQVRTELLLEKGWKFTREDNPQSIQASYDDSRCPSRLGYLRSF